MVGDNFENGPVGLSPVNKLWHVVSSSWLVAIKPSQRTVSLIINLICDARASQLYH